VCFAINVIAKHTGEPEPIAKGEWPVDAPTVWIISHDPDTRRLISLNLNRRGFQIQEFSSPGELPSSGARPLLIFLDANLPDEPDWEAIGVLRQVPSTSGVTLILLLADAPATSRLAPFQPVRWIEKPLAIDTLLLVAREELGDQRSE
jgi:DNA-binding response OmpR family regulator